MGLTASDEDALAGGEAAFRGGLGASWGDLVQHVVERQSAHANNHVRYAPQGLNEVSGERLVPAGATCIIINVLCSKEGSQPMLIIMYGMLRRPG